MAAMGHYTGAQLTGVLEICWTAAAFSKRTKVRLWQCLLSIKKDAFLCLKSTTIARPMPQNGKFVLEESCGRNVIKIKCIMCILKSLNFLVYQRVQSGAQPKFHDISPFLQEKAVKIYCKSTCHGYGPVEKALV